MREQFFLCCKHFLNCSRFEYLIQTNFQRTLTFNFNWTKKIFSRNFALLPIRNLFILSHHLFFVISELQKVWGSTNKERTENNNWTKKHFLLFSKAHLSVLKSCPWQTENYPDLNIRNVPSVRTFFSHLDWNEIQRRIRGISRNWC